jgi:hypothetical protein
MFNEVQITGGGVAACCCAALLSKAGMRVFADLPGRGGSPTLMLSDQTQHLFTDVFGGGFVQQDAVKINKRLVRWGRDSETVTLPHSGLVVSEAALLARLWPTLKLQSGKCSEANHWNVISNKKDLPAVNEHKFGARIALTNSVELSAGASRDACWVESTDSGWLFLIPCGEGRGSLISVGAPADVLLTESRLVVDQITGLLESTGSFPAYPRIVSPLCAEGWIACGTAAIAFDPISGEGAGNAMREGILASAVIRSAAQGLPAADLLAHYSSRLVSGFLRHLQACCQFYTTGGSGGWWQAEVELMKLGMAQLPKEMLSNPTSLFKLVGFELQSISA